LYKGCFAFWETPEREEKRMLPVKLAGLGWYLPERRVTNAELEAQLGIPADWIERVTGVRERRYVTHETMLAMGVAASHRALENARLHVEELDAIISATCAPQHFSNVNLEHRREQAPVLISTPPASASSSHSRRSRTW